MLYSRDTRRREAGYRSPPQETESHKWINSCMSGLTHLFLWCAQTAVILCLKYQLEFSPIHHGLIPL